MKKNHSKWMVLFAVMFFAFAALAILPGCSTWDRLFGKKDSTQDIKSRVNATQTALTPEQEEQLNRIETTGEDTNKNVGRGKTGLSLHDKMGEPKKPGDTLFSVGYSTNDKVGRIGTDVKRLARKSGKPVKHAKGGVTPPPAGKKAVAPPTGKSGKTPAVSGKNCSLKTTYSKGLEGKNHCDAVAKMVSLGAACYGSDQKAYLNRQNRTCMSYKKYGARFQRMFRAATTDRIQRGWGKDLNNGFEENEGGQIFEFIGGAATLFAVLDWGSNNLLTSKQQDKWLDRNPVIHGGGGGGTQTGPTENPPTGGGAQIGPGEPGGTSYSNTLPNTDMNALANQFPSAGGPGIYGTNHPIANGASWSGNNTLPSNLTKDGYSAGNTKISNLFEDGGSGAGLFGN